jgi:hypothetical protein
LKATTRGIFLSCIEVVQRIHLHKKSVNKGHSWYLWGFQKSVEEIITKDNKNVLNEELQHLFIVNFGVPSAKFKKEN